MDTNNTESDQAKSNSQPNRWLIAGLAVIIIAIGSYRFGYAAGKKGLIFQPKDFKVTNQNNQTVEVDYSLLWEALDTVGKNYIDKGSIDQEKVLYGAIRGAVSAAGDQYTEFFSPEDFKNFKTQLAGSFEGIGAEVGKKEGSIVIIAPLDGTPAQRAGLLAQDAIVQIDGQSTAEMSVDDAVTKIRGNRGTEVTLTIYREGRDNTFDVKIKRDKITTTSVKWSYQTVNGKNIQVLKLSRFGDDTEDLIAQAIRDGNGRKIDGIVLDLRDDPGGYLESAVNVASNWVPKDKVIVTEEQGDGTSQPYNSRGFGKLTNVKTVVLINGGSASAAEIVAGALQDHNISKLVGEKSYGKGSVQQLFDLPGNSAVKVTVAKWITPSGKNLNKEGLRPDIEVTRTEDDIKNNKDPQLDKDLEEVVK